MQSPPPPRRWSAPSFFEEEEELTLWPVFTGTVPSAGRRTQFQDIPRIQKGPTPFPAGPFPNAPQSSSPSAQKPSIPPKAEAKTSEPKPLTSPRTRCSWYTLAFFQTFQRFCQGGDWALEVNSPQVQPELGSRLKFLLVVCVIAVHPLALASFMAHSTLASLFSPAFCSSQPSAGPYCGETWLPTLVLQFPGK